MSGLMTSVCCDDEWMDGFKKAYDVYGPSFSNRTGPNAPLLDTCSEPKLKFSVSQSIQQWISTGTPSQKLILGLPTYGYGYTTLNPNLTLTTFSGAHTFSSLLFQTSSLIVPSSGKTADVGIGNDVCGNPNQPGGQWLFKELAQTGKLSRDGKKGLGGYQRHYDHCTHTVRLFYFSSNPPKKKIKKK